MSSIGPCSNSPARAIVRTDSFPSVRNRPGKYVEDEHARNDEKQADDCRNVQSLPKEQPCNQGDQAMPAPDHMA